MRIESITWVRVGAFVRERETGGVYRITDCPETVALCDIRDEGVEVVRSGARRSTSLLEFLREFKSARKPKDWEEPPLVYEYPKPATNFPGAHALSGKVSIV